MKSRRIVVTAFLLCACLIIGVGYAALSDILEVTGTGLLSEGMADTEFEKDVYFKEVTTRTNCTAVIDASDTTGDTVIITIADTTSKMAVKGDTATATLVVANDSLEAVHVTLNSINDPNGYFSISCDEQAGFDIIAGTNNGDGTVTPGTTTIVVTVTLEKTVDATLATLNDGKGATFKLELTAESVSA
ncbi:MAG: hypothetical protein IJY20_01500 [Clostridia bacterium]|nr:hypothetical protein [Clostridia bacterium]